MSLTGPLTFENVMRIVSGHDSGESWTDEIYAVAQLLELGKLSIEEQKKLGKKLVEEIENENALRNLGAFNDE